MFADELIKSIKKLNNPTVAGLDPKLEYVPVHIREIAFKDAGYGFEGAAAAILEFNKKLIDALCGVVPAVKPQLAYYEMYGVAGVKAFADTCSYAKSKGMLVIADGKRNDIGSTAEAYSTAYLGKTAVGFSDGNVNATKNNMAGGTAVNDINNTSNSVAVNSTSDSADEDIAFIADALTVNPYLGYDGIKPFVDNCSRYGKGIFVLVKTSNKTSGQLQDLVTKDGKTIYETVAELVDSWGSGIAGEYGYSSVGAVVGATYPEQARILRKIMKKAYILVPGYGAQGGTAEDAVQSFNEDGLGAVINASRSIMCAWKSEKWSSYYGEDSFDSAARAEAIRMRDEINNALAAR